MRVIEGIGVFFFHRLPRSIYDFIISIYIWEYLVRLARIVARVVRIVVLSAVLAAIVFGPAVVLYYFDAQRIYQLVWAVCIIVALLFSLQRYVRKEYQRRKRLREERVGRRQVCSHCRTDPGAVIPANCVYCGKPWVGAEL